MDRVAQERSFYQHGVSAGDEYWAPAASCYHRLSLQGSDLRHFPAMGGDNTGIFKLVFAVSNEARLR